MYYFLSGITLYECGFSPGEYMTVKIQWLLVEFSNLVLFVVKAPVWIYHLHYLDNVNSEGKNNVLIFIYESSLNFKDFPESPLREPEVWGWEALVLVSYIPNILLLLIK